MKLGYARTEADIPGRYMSIKVPFIDKATLDEQHTSIVTIECGAETGVKNAQRLKPMHVEQYTADAEAAGGRAGAYIVATKNLGHTHRSLTTTPKAYGIVSSLVLIPQ